MSDEEQDLFPSVKWLNKWGKTSTPHIVDAEEDGEISFLCGQTVTPSDQEEIVREKLPLEDEDLCQRCVKSEQTPDRDRSSTGGFDWGRSTHATIEHPDFDPKADLCIHCYESYRRNRIGLIWLCRTNGCRDRLGCDKIHIPEDGDPVFLIEEGKDYREAMMGT